MALKNFMRVGSYSVIDQLSYTLQGSPSTSILLRVYKDDTKSEQISTSTYTVDVVLGDEKFLPFSVAEMDKVGKNIIKIWYEHLKTLPEFSKVSDV